MERFTNISGRPNDNAFIEKSFKINNFRIETPKLSDLARKLLAVTLGSVKSPSIRFPIQLHKNFSRYAHLNVLCASTICHLRIISFAIPDAQTSLSSLLCVNYAVNIDLKYLQLNMKKLVDWSFDLSKMSSVQWHRARSTHPLHAR